MLHLPAPPSAARSILLLSAQSEAALLGVARAHATWLHALARAAAPVAWADICAIPEPTNGAFRLAVTAMSVREAACRLDGFCQGVHEPGCVTGQPASGGVAFVYSGNGPQWWAMGRQLLETDAIFRAELAAIDAIFAVRTGWSLISELSRPQAGSRMALTEVAQPTLFALQLGLTAMLRAAGITPDAVLGHSVGEVAAAHVSRALSRAQAVEIIVHCSTMQARTAGTGGMAAFGIDVATAQAAIDQADGQLDLAAVNAPLAVTLAGDRRALQALQDRVAAQGRPARMLKLDYPFHSRAMEPIREALLTRLDGLTPRETEVPLISTLEARPVAGAELGPDYWWRSMRQPVRFADAVDHALADGITTFIEIGPHPVLCDYMVQCARAKHREVSVLATLRRPAADGSPGEADAIWRTIGACYAQGIGRREPMPRDRPLGKMIPTVPPEQRLRSFAPAPVSGAMGIAAE